MVELFVFRIVTLEHVVVVGLKAAVRSWRFPTGGGEGVGVATSLKYRVVHDRLRDGWNRDPCQGGNVFEAFETHT